MSEVILRFSHQLEDSSGRAYTATVRGERRADGTWEGWLEFQPSGGAGAIRRTGRETSQPEREDLEFWASGLEPVYLEGALARAH